MAHRELAVPANRYVIEVLVHAQAGVVHAPVCGGERRYEIPIFCHRPGRDGRSLFVAASNTAAAIIPSNDNTGC